MWKETLPKSAHELLERMKRLNIQEKDLEEKFVTAQGPGGQNVNKVATCVILRYPPSGLSVRCQKERSQAANRFIARCLLVSKIEKRYNDTTRAIKELTAKKKRQNRKRHQGLKEDILEKKRLQSQKKIFRQKIQSHQIDNI